MLSSAATCVKLDCRACRLALKLACIDLQFTSGGPLHRLEMRLLWHNGPEQFEVLFQATCHRSRGCNLLVAFKQGSGPPLPQNIPPSSLYSE